MVGGLVGLKGFWVVGREGRCDVMGREVERGWNVRSDILKRRGKVGLSGLWNFCWFVD